MVHAPNPLSDPMSFDDRSAQPLVRAILRVFLEGARDRLDAARSAENARDLVEVGRLARELEGLADRLASSHVHLLASQLAYSASQDDGDAVRSLLRELESFVSRQIACLDLALPIH